MPVGVNDIVALAKLALAVWQSASSQYTCGNHQYKAFVDDLHTLQRVTDDLETAVQSPSVTELPSRFTDNFVESVLSEAKRTLKTCERLIRQNPRFQRDGTANNIVWLVSIKEIVEKLQTRIQICFHKINFVLRQQDERNRREELEIIVATNLDTQRLVQQVAHHVEVPAPPSVQSLLSDAVQSRFTAVQRSRSDGGVFSISEKIDALLVFYEESTYNFDCQPPSMTTPTTIQYLNLLKCIYLLKIIEEDPEFRRFCERPMSLAWWQFRANKVQKEAGRFLDANHEIERVSDADLLRLEDNDFIVDLRHLLETSELDTASNVPNQELVMQKTLVSMEGSVEQLHVHRMTASRLLLIKTVSTSTHADSAITDRSELELDVQTVSIDPLYARSPVALPNIIWKLTSSDTYKRDPHFANLQDVKDFQKVITNHIVVFDHDSLESGYKKVSYFDGAGKKFADSGRIQLWSYEDPVHPEIYTKQPPSHRSSMAQSPDSSLAPSTLHSENTFTTRTVDELTQRRVLRSGSQGHELVKPMPYQIVIMVPMDDKQKLISIRIDENTNFNPHKCRCSERHSTCRQVVIDHEKNKLHVTTVVPCAGNNNDGGNLAVFGKVDRHTHHHDLRHANEEYAKHIVLTFKDIPSKDAFEDSLRKACIFMRKKHNDYQIAENKLGRVQTF